MDSCPSIKICEKDIIRKLGEKSQLEGYVINWDMKSDLEQIVSAVDSVIQYFHKNEIPYNTLWTRGKDEGTGNSLVFFVKCIQFISITGAPGTYRIFEKYFFIRNISILFFFILTQISIVLPPGGPCRGCHMYYCVHLRGWSTQIRKDIQMLLNFNEMFFI
jgi:hypothetical protein